MKKVVLLLLIALLAGCQNNDADEGNDDSRQPSVQYNTTPEVTHEVTVERTLPSTGGII